MTHLAVAKHVKSSDRFDVYQNEKKWLQILAGSNITPRLIVFDDETRTLVTEFGGEPISSGNLPKDTEQQIEYIISELARHNCRHNDIKPQEILVRDGKIRLVDFGWAWELDQENPPEWEQHASDLDQPSRGYKCKDGTFNDSCVIRQIMQQISPRNSDGAIRGGDVEWPTKPAHGRSLALGGSIESACGSEQHLMIDWTNHFPERDVHNLIQTTSALHLSQTISRPRLLEGEQLITMSRFYNTTLVDDHRGRTAFTIYVIYDTEPNYEQRNTWKGIRRVNSKIFDLKQHLRRLVGNNSHMIYATDNIQEVSDTSCHACKERQMFSFDRACCAD